GYADHLVVASANETYEYRCAFDESEELRGFEWFMDTVADAIRIHPGMHVYHYAPYEPSAFKRLMGRYATRERELDAMLRSGRFVDLYGVVRQGLRAGVERYSIKNLEPLYGYERLVSLPDANRSLKVMQLGLEMECRIRFPMKPGMSSKATTATTASRRCSCGIGSSACARPR